MKARLLYRVMSVFVKCIVKLLQVNAELCVSLNDSSGRHGRSRSRSPFSSRRRHQGDRVSFLHSAVTVVVGS